MNNKELFVIEETLSILAAAVANIYCELDHLTPVGTMAIQENLAKLREAVMGQEPYAKESKL